MKHYLNVCDINGAEVAPVDVITFGSPCQDLSVAGKRAGIQDGERSNLFFQAVRIIKEMRKATNGEYPKYAVWENVPGAFSSNKGRDFHSVLEALCSVCDSSVSIPEPYDERGADRLVWLGAGEIVGDGYSVAWRTLDAQYWGVPQRRKRIYLVADFTGGRAGEILFKPDSLHGNPAESGKAGQGAAADAVGSVDGSSGVVGIDGYNFSITGDKSATIGVNCGMSTGRNGVIESVDGSVGVECLNPWDCQSKRVYMADGIYPTLPAMDCGGRNNQAVIALQGNGIDRADTAGCYGIDHVITTGGNCTAQGPCVYEGVQATLKAGGVHAVCYDARGNGDHQNRITDYTAVAVQETLCFDETQITSPTNGNNPQWNEPSHPLASTARPPTVICKKPPRKYIIRRLTPTECARLQGFPDKWGHLAPYNPADAEFWESVRKTHAEINGKAYKPCKNLKKWYEGLHTDSAEYKMWGNGIALPCAENVLHGLAEQGAKTLASLFDGSGGFPLAGMMNGITPLWSSEIEPYPIAVTISRFPQTEQERTDKVVISKTETTTTAHIRAKFMQIHNTK